VGEGKGYAHIINISFYAYPGESLVLH
jgi:hypothetical protein